MAEKVISPYRYTSKFVGRTVPIKYRIAYFIRASVFLPILAFELPSLRGRAPSRSIHATKLLNDISNSTHGKGLEFFHKITSWLRRNDTRLFDLSIPIPNTRSGQLFEDSHLDNLVAELRLRGCVAIPGFMGGEECTSLLTSIHKMNGSARPSGLAYETQFGWMAEPDSGPRFDTNQQVLGDNPLVTDLKDNGLILNISRRYLHCAPVLASIQSWTTRPPIDNLPETLDETAMAFHCDSDYFGFLKFFILLTKVEVENGPFAFITGSHRGDRHVAGRMPDQALLSPGDSVFLGTGEPGDLIIADTKGWHKASPPTQGQRTMLQFVFAGSLFGRSS